MLSGCWIKVFRLLEKAQGVLICMLVRFSFWMIADWSVLRFWLLMALMGRGVVEVRPSPVGVVLVTRSILLIM